MSGVDLKLARKIRNGLAHCLPADGEAGGVCMDCGYYDRVCACEDREIAALPAALVQDMRELLGQLLKEGNG